ncbi:hypothetical protein HDF24_18700 [Mucilaginibacter sp. X4EP1]|jgi:hypothetical protein|nr:hypothetical protein [Mucilaginibacter sp. X4EP1]MCS3813397.1 hypothetical protein [Mucilaginibacter sp. X4EP1]
MKGKNASKEKKKAPAENTSKNVSDYQSGKKSASSIGIVPVNKKK